MADDRTRGYWEGRAGSLALRINAATWLERAAPNLFYVACAVAVAVYAFRRVELPLMGAWIGFFVAAAAVGSWIAWRARRSFFTGEDARVFLESQLRLETRLTAATSGLVSWPSQPQRPERVLRWQPRVPAAWMLAALVLVLAAMYIPVPAGSITADFRGPPPALVETREMLADLKEMKVADPQALERLEQRAEELEKRSPDEQYKHASLEAADALKNQVAAAQANLASGMDAAAAALRGANEGQTMQESAARLADALASLAAGTLPADQNILTQIPGTALDLSALSPAAREALAQQLQKMGAGGQGKGGKGKGDGKGNGDGDGDGDGDGQGKGRGKGSGRGGRGGNGQEPGGGPADLSFGDKSDAGKGRLESAGKSDLSNIAMGDKVGQTVEAPKVDASKLDGPGSAGAIASPALGGEAVWVNRLTPAERSALKKFFK